MPPATFQMSGFLVPELTGEFAKTRRSLERASDEHADFKPHPKSMSLLTLCNHLATVSGFARTILTVDSVDLGSSTDPRRIVKEPNGEAILKAFDELAVSALTALPETDDDSFHRSWELRRGELVVFSGTRYGALRNIGVNHMIHHRAQLGIYLRHLDLPVPALFGPSADER